MARRRMIDPNIWQSEDFAALSTLAKVVFIGLFSNADDEGRGRAKPVYIKSILFPYDDQLRVTDIERTIQEISSRMSITFYEHDGREYYSLDNWGAWQRVDKAQPSKIPPPPSVESAENRDAEAVPENFQNDSGMILEFVENDSGMIPEFVENDSGLKEKKRREEKRKEEKESIGVPPTLQQVQEYCNSRNNGVNAQRFMDFYSSKGWMVGKNKMKDWKAAVRTWENRQKSEKAGNDRYIQRAETQEQLRARVYDPLEEVDL